MPAGRRRRCCVSLRRMTRLRPPMAVRRAGWPCGSFTARPLLLGRRVLGNFRRHARDLDRPVAAELTDLAMELVLPLDLHERVAARELVGRDDVADLQREQV